jgi:hypothetical protein
MSGRERRRVPWARHAAAINGRGQGGRKGARAGSPGGGGSGSVAGVASGARRDLIAAHAWPTGTGLGRTRCVLVAL